MMKIYCSGCGHACLYEAIKPNFCEECGQSLGVIVKPKISPTTVKPIPKVIMNRIAMVKSNRLDEDDDDEITPCDLDNVNLKVSIKLPPSPKIRLGDIVGTLPPDAKLNKRAKTKVNRKSALENFKKMAGGYSAKNSSTEIQGG